MFFRQIVEPISQDRVRAPQPHRLQADRGQRQARRPGRPRLPEQRPPQLYLRFLRVRHGGGCARSHRSSHHQKGKILFEFLEIIIY